MHAYIHTQPITPDMMTSVLDEGALLGRIPDEREHVLCNDLEVCFRVL